MCLYVPLEQRAISEFEQSMARGNFMLLFRRNFKYYAILLANPKTAHISSTLVREIASFGGR